MKNLCIIVLFFILMSSCQQYPIPKMDGATFSDTVAISFDTNFASRDYLRIYCNIEINGIVFDTVLVDNGYYYSGISPDMVRKLKMTYTAIESTPTATAFEPDVYVDTCITCIADNLYIKPGHTVLQLDTIYITKWHEIAGKPSCKAVLGRDFFEKYIVEIDFHNGFMTWGNRLPPSINQYLAIPMDHLGGNNPNCRIIKANGFKGKNGNPLVARVFLDLGNCIPHAGFDASFLKRVDQHFSQIDTSSLAWLILSTIGSAVDSLDFPVEHMDNDSRRVNAKIPGSLLPDWDGFNVDILLGNDFFRHFNVIFDYKNNMLYLKRNE